MSGKMFSNIPNEFEPIRKDLFSLEFPVSMNIPEQFIVSGTRPHASNPRKEVPFKNMTTYYKGKTTFDEITFVFRDAIGPAVYQKLHQWFREHTDFVTGRGGYAATYKKNLTLNMEDPTGAVIQRFTLFGCFLTSLDGGEVSMDSDDIAQITISISYDSYELEF